MAGFPDLMVVFEEAIPAPTSSPLAQFEISRDLFWRFHQTFFGSSNSGDPGK